MKTVQAILRQAVHQTLKEVAAWTDGWFVFEMLHDQTEPPPEWLFGTEEILLDVLRELDEEGNR